MDWKSYIVFNREILLGKPVIKGTRISVELIKELIAIGWTEDMILESYPSLQKVIAEPLLSIEESRAYSKELIRKWASEE